MFSLDYKNSELLKETKKFMHGEHKFPFRDFIDKCLTINVAEDGSVWSWGTNALGRVQNISTYSVNSVVPECVSLLKGKNIINLWSMGQSTIVLCDGTHILNTFFFRFNFVVFVC